MSVTLHDLSACYCYRRRSVAIREWYHALRIAEEVHTLRERATVLRYAYIAYLVISLGRCRKLFRMTSSNVLFCYAEYIVT